MNEEETLLNHGIVAMFAAFVDCVMDDYEAAIKLIQSPEEKIKRMFGNKPAKIKNATVYDMRTALDFLKSAPKLGKRMMKIETQYGVTREEVYRRFAEIDRSHSLSGTDFAPKSSIRLNHIKKRYEDKRLYGGGK